MFENSWADVWTSYDTIIVCGMLKWNENILTFLWWCYVSLSRRRSIYIRKMCVIFCCEWRLMTDERKIKQNNFSIYFDLECDAKYLCASSRLAYLLNLRTVLVFFCTPFKSQTPLDIFFLFIWDVIACVWGKAHEVLTRNFLQVRSLTFII